MNKIDTFIERLRKKSASWTKKANREFYTLKKGQRFQECDRRYTRVVEIVGFKNKRVRIKTILNEVNSCMPHPPSLKLGRITTASRHRFHRRSHGYKRLCGKCNECQLKAGAEMPKGALMGVTCTMGVCSGCLKVGASLVPSSDYNWPKEGRRAIFD